MIIFQKIAKKTNPKRTKNEQKAKKNEPKRAKFHNFLLAPSPKKVTILTSLLSCTKGFENG